MQILVIAGFLGAGKTTFIKELVKRIPEDYVIMENDYGTANVDGDILRKTDSALNIWELAEGCVCCSAKGDFASSILTIANTLDPKYLLVEPSGVGSLSRILDHIRKIQYERISLLAPIVIVDGLNFKDSKKEYGQLWADQLASAETVVITKLESEDEAKRAEVFEAVRRINPNASVCSRHYQKMDLSWWQSLLQKKLSDGEQASFPLQEEESAMESVTLTSIALENENQLILFLQGVVSGVFGKIYRCKGYLRVGASWLRFDVVNHTYSVTGYTPADDSKGIFIGKDLKRGRLREVLQKSMYLDAASPLSSRKEIRKKRLR